MHLSNKNMYSSETKVRVRYGETDKMNYVYYGNYALFYELGRTEMLRDLGFTYRNIEENGFMLPVLSMNSNYIKSASYDDLLTIRTTIKVKPMVKIKFDYEIYNEQNELINKGDTTLVFIDIEKNKPAKSPEFFNIVIDKYFE